MGFKAWVRHERGCHPKTPSGSFCGMGGGRERASMWFTFNILDAPFSRLFFVLPLDLPDEIRVLNCVKNFHPKLKKNTEL